jgi:hypothetical protein
MILYLIVCLETVVLYLLYILYIYIIYLRFYNPIYLFITDCCFSATDYEGTITSLNKTTYIVTDLVVFVNTLFQSFLIATEHP